MDLKPEDEQGKQRLRRPSVVYEEKIPVLNARHTRRGSSSCTMIGLRITDFAPADTTDPGGGGGGGRELGFGAEVPAATVNRRRKKSADAMLVRQHGDGNGNGSIKEWRRMSATRKVKASANFLDEASVHLNAGGPFLTTCL